MLKKKIMKKKAMVILLNKTHDHQYVSVHA